MANIAFTYPRKFIDPTDALNGRALEDYLRDRAFQSIKVSDLEADMVLVDQTIQSNDYVDGESGWIIHSDGSAQFNDVIIRSDLYSANWDGAIPANLATADAAATVGFYLDSSVGAAQFKSIYVEGGQIGNLDIVNDLELLTGGVLYSGPKTGYHFRIANAFTGNINWYNGTTFRASIGVGAGTYASMTFGSSVVASAAAFFFYGSTTTPGRGWIDSYCGFRVNSTHADGQILAQDGTLANPGLSYINDPDTGWRRSAANQMAASAGAHTPLLVQPSGQNVSTVARGKGACITYSNDRTLGGTSGNNLILHSWTGTDSNQAELRLELLRVATGTSWSTSAWGFRRITDSTSQASLWFYGDRIGVGVSGPVSTLTVAGNITASPTTTGSAGNAYWGALSGYYQLYRYTSARKYKTHIDYDVDWLADFELRPAKFYREDDGRWFYNFIADDLADQDELLGVYGDDGEVESFDSMAVLAIMAAKINRLEELVLRGSK